MGVQLLARLALRNEQPHQPLVDLLLLVLAKAAGHAPPRDPPGDATLLDVLVDDVAGEDRPQ